MADQMDQEYLAKRQLKRGTAGWLLLAGLGVSYVISGDFAGWNFGIGEAGWGGFAIAAVLMGLMYLTLVLSLAEMSASIPAFGRSRTKAGTTIKPPPIPSRPAIKPTNAPRQKSMTTKISIVNNLFFTCSNKTSQLLLF